MRHHSSRSSSRSSSSIIIIMSVRFFLVRILIALLLSSLLVRQHNVVEAKFHVLPSSSSSSSSSYNDESNNNINSNSNSNINNEEIDAYKDCSEIFVGGGWAGIYSLYRRVMEDPTIRGPKACLFEQSWRIGGRTYSVPINQTKSSETSITGKGTTTTTTPFVLDVGAYRFSPDMHLPGDLILKELNIPTQCYDKRCPNAQDDFPPPFIFNYTTPFRRIVNPATGLPSGFVTPLHMMLDRAKEFGARVFTQISLVELKVKAETIQQQQYQTTAQQAPNHNMNDNNSIVMKFKNENTGNTFELHDPSLVMLNLPRNKLFEVNGIEESLPVPIVNTLKCVVSDMPPDLFAPNPPIDGQVKYLKAYMYFKDAFWYTKLNLKGGYWPPDNNFFGHMTKEGVRFTIRWHDGPIHCGSTATVVTTAAASSSARFTTCEGFLEAYYSLSNETFYSSIVPSPDEPLGSIWITDGPEAVEKLKTAHAGLVDILIPLLEEKGLSVADLDDTDIIPQPMGIIVGSWDLPSQQYPLGRGYTGPNKVYFSTKMSGTPDQACGVPGLTTESYREVVLRPWGPHVPIFLANNDWVCEDIIYYWGEWAEESLLQAERAMFYLGSKKPDWLDKSYYEEKILAKVDEIPSSPTTTTTRNNILGGDAIEINNNNVVDSDHHVSYHTLTLVESSKQSQPQRIRGGKN